MKKVVHVFTVSMSIIFLEDLYSRLKERGYELIVICSDGEEVRYQEKIGNFKFYPVNMSRGINPLKDIIALLKIIIILIKERPTIVHGHTPKGGFLAMIAAKIVMVKNRPYHLHGLKFPGEVGIKRKIVQAMEKTTILLSTDVFAVSESLQKYAIKERMGTTEKIKVILNGSIKGIDIEKSKTIIEKGSSYYKSKLGIIDTNCIVGFVGRVTEEKGILEFIEAIEKLIIQGYNIGVVVCGENELKSHNSKMKFSRFLELKNIQYFGAVKEPLEYMVCFDIFTLPTYREGFGLVNIEANSVGVPVITTNIVGCIDSIEKNVTGITVNPKNSDALYHALRTLIKDPSTRKNMGLKGIQRAMDLYDRSKVWNSLIDEYDNMLLEGGK